MGAGVGTGGAGGGGGGGPGMWDGERGKGGKGDREGGREGEVEKMGEGEADGGKVQSERGGVGGVGGGKRGKRSRGLEISPVFALAPSFEVGLHMGSSSNTPILPCQLAADESRRAARGAWARSMQAGVVQAMGVGRVAAAVGGRMGQRDTAAQRPRRRRLRVGLASGQGRCGWVVSP